MYSVNDTCALVWPNLSARPSYGIRSVNHFSTYFLWFWRKIRVSRLNFLRFWSHAWALFNASAEALACPLAPSPARKTSPRVQTKEQWCPREVFGRTWPSKHRPGYIPKLAPEVVKKWFLTFMILLVTTFTKNVDSWLLKNTEAVISFSCRRFTCSGKFSVTIVVTRKIPLSARQDGGLPPLKIENLSSPGV
jgi:hypothetical protein